MANIDTITLVRRGALAELPRIGPSLSGWIYGDATSGCYARALPISEVKVDVRRAYERHAGVEHPHCAMVIEAKQDLRAHGLFVVLYDAGAGADPLDRFLATADFGARLRALADVCDALTGWWAVGGAPLLLSVSDIVRASDGRILLLLRHASRELTAAALFEAPRRIHCLAPDYFRPASNPDACRDDALDLFALGRLMCRTLMAPDPSGPADRSLERAVLGRQVEEIRPDASLPHWVQRLPAVARLEDIIKTWTSIDADARRALAPAAVAATLRQLAESSLPVDAVREAYRQENSQAIAYGFLLDILKKEESYALLMEAGWRAIALMRGVEALDHYERAIAMVPCPTEACREQLKLICRAGRGDQPALTTAFERDITFAAKADAWLARDFEHLVTFAPTDAVEHEVPVAEHGIWRARRFPWMLTDVARFIHARMHPNRSWDPRRLELNALFAETLFVQDRPADTRSQLTRVEGLLADKRLVQHAIPRGSVERARTRVRNLRAALALREAAR